jgi:hypothetical protein
MRRKSEAPFDSSFLEKRLVYFEVYADLKGGEGCKMPDFFALKAYFFDKHIDILMVSEDIYFECVTIYLNQS